MVAAPGVMTQSMPCDAHAGNITLESLQLTAKIKLMDWVPQNDVLGHPAVKAFLSHAGINSIYEAAYQAVPVVSVPLIADQVNNAVLVKTLLCCHATICPALPSSSACPAPIHI